MRTAEQQRIYERKRRWRLENPEKAKASVDNFYARNPHARREKHLLAKYGISKEEYHRRLGEQLGMCAVCRSETAGRSDGTFVVDHCHTSGKVRGLLCHPCNAAIGFAQEDPGLLRRLADYVEGKHE